MHVQENETLKLLWDFEKQTDHLISAWRPDIVIVYKKKKKKKKERKKRKKKEKKKKVNLPNCELCRFSWQQGKTERKRKER